MPYRIDDLPDQLIEEVDDLYQRYGALSAQPECAATAQEAGQLALEAERLDVPDLTVLIRMLAFAIRGIINDYPGALREYAGCLREVTRHREWVDPDLRRLVLDAARGITLVMIVNPDLTLQHIEQFIDAIEDEHRSHGVSTALISAMRAHVAAERDDFDGVRAHFEEWQVLRRRHEEKVNFGFGLEIGVYADFDLAFALAELDRRRGEEVHGDKDAMRVGALRAWLIAMLGDPDAALDSVRDLIDEHGLDAVLEHAGLDDLLPVVESDEALAGAVADRLRSEIETDQPDCVSEIARLARWELLRDPDSSEGLALRRQAEQHAARFDARNGNDRYARSVRRDLGLG